MAIRFIQLSDIHFGQELRDGSTCLHDDVRAELIRDAEGMAKTRGPATRVLVAGDTAYSGKKAEFDRAGEFLDRLTAAVGCSPTQVRLVPGNHDCDRSQDGPVSRIVHSQLRTGSIESAHGFLEDMANSPEETNPLLPKLGAYRTFASGYSSPLNTIGKPLWTEDYDLGSGISLRLVGLNSVQVCDANDRIGTMILGGGQYTLQTVDHVVYAVMVHHPLDWFMDKVKAKQYLHNRARLLMVGHEHVAEISHIRGLEAERLEISSGATNPPEQGDLYKHAYNWIEIESSIVQTLPILHVTVFPRVWVPERTLFDADRNRLTGQSSRRFDIACHGTTPRPVRTVTETAGKAAVAGTAMVVHHENADSGTAVPTNVSGGIAMNSNDEQEGLAKLKLLFWRYLDWRQRLTVLVKTDVLPATADKPVPHSLEELAIERARIDGKLGLLWDAMTALLPEDKRQDNPFTPSER